MDKIIQESYNSTSNENRNSNQARIESQNFEIEHFNFFDSHNTQREEIVPSRIDISHRNSEVSTPISYFGEKTLYKSAAFGKELHTGSIRWMVLSTDMSTLYTGGSDCLIHIWNLHTRKRRNILEGHIGTIQKIILSSSESLLYSASSDKTIRVFEVETCTCKAVLSGHSGTILDIVISKNEDLLYSSSADNSIKIWNLVSKKCVKTMTGHKDFVWNLALASNSNWLLSASFDGSLRRWSLDTYKHAESSSFDAKGIFAMTLTEDELKIYTGHDNGCVKVWLVETLSVFKSFNCPSVNRIRRLLLIEQDTSLLSASEDGNMVLWDTDNGLNKTIHTSGIENTSVFAISADCSKLVTFDKDSNLNIWHSFMKLSSVGSKNQFEVNRNSETLMTCDLGTALAIKNIEYNEPLDDDEYILTLGNLEGKISLRVELAKKSILQESCDWQKTNELSLGSFSELVGRSVNVKPQELKEIKRDLEKNYQFLQAKSENEPKLLKKNFPICASFKIMEQMKRDIGPLLSRDELEIEKIIDRATIAEENFLELASCVVSSVSISQLRKKCESYLVRIQRKNFSNTFLFSKINSLLNSLKTENTNHLSQEFTFNVLLQSHQRTVPVCSQLSHLILEPGNDTESNNFSDNTRSGIIKSMANNNMMIEDNRFIRGSFGGGKKCCGSFVEIDESGIFYCVYQQGKKTAIIEFSNNSVSQFNIISPSLPNSSNFEFSYPRKPDWQRLLLVSPVFFSLFFLPLNTFFMHPSPQFIPRASYRSG